MGRFDEALELLHQTLVEIDGQKEYIKYQIITLKRMGNLRIKIGMYNDGYDALENIVRVVNEVHQKSDEALQNEVVKSKWLNGAKSAAIVHMVVTKQVRHFIAKGKLTWACIKVQNVFRGYQARKEVKLMIRERRRIAATKIQSLIRRYIHTNGTIGEKASAIPSQHFFSQTNFSWKIIQMVETNSI